MSSDTPQYPHNFKTLPDLNARQVSKLHEARDTDGRNDRPSVQTAAPYGGSANHDPVGPMRASGQRQVAAYGRLAVERIASDDQTRDKPT